MGNAYSRPSKKICLKVIYSTNIQTVVESHRHVIFNDNFIMPKNYNSFLMADMKVFQKQILFIN